MRNEQLITQPTVELFLSYIGEGSLLPIILRLLPYSTVIIFAIQQRSDNNTRRKKVLQSKINLKTGCSLTGIYKITNALGDVVKDKFSDKDDYVELKLFPGLKVTSRYIPSEQSVSKRLNINSNYSIFMSAVFTDDFRKKVRELHNNLE